MPVKPKTYKPLKRKTHKAPEQRERFYNWQWTKLRNAYLREHGLCVFCLAKGKITTATVVDHIVPHRNRDARLFWSQDNWQSLCAPCHNSDKQRLEKSGRKARRIGADGYPIGEG